MTNLRLPIPVQRGLRKLGGDEIVSVDTMDGFKGRIVVKTGTGTRSYVQKSAMWYSEPDFVEVTYLSPLYLRLRDAYKSACAREAYGK